MARRRPFRAGDVTTICRAAIKIGLGSDARSRFWRLIGNSVVNAPHTFGWAIAHAIQGEHMIRYTREHVGPRLETALAQVRAERVRRAQQASRSRAVSA